MGPVDSDSLLLSPWAPHIIAAGIGSAATVAGAVVYSRFFRRIPTTDAIKPAMIAQRRWIKGIVTRYVGRSYPPTGRLYSRSVGDADNFRLYHTPGLFWSLPLKFRRVPTVTKGAVTGRHVITTLNHHIHH